MSRVEKNIQKRYKKRKLRLLSKIIFMMCMVINLMICIVIIDSNAKKMLGEETYNIQSIVDNLGDNIKEVFNNINLDEIKDNIINNFNK